MKGNRWPLHVLGLWALAVAHPIFDLLAGSPEFFVAHRASSADILLLILAVVVLVPAPLLVAIALSSLIGRRTRSVAVAVLVAVLAAMISLQALNQTGVGRWTVAVPIAAVLGMLVGIAYSRLAAVRTFATLLSAAIVVVPLVFAARPAIRGLLVPAAARAAWRSTTPVPAARAVPVVMIVFDELPLLSLLDPDGNLDAALYPNFAAVAKDGIWYRNATTVNDYTRWALPAILDGRYPHANAVPTRSYYFDTLFTFIARSHRLEVDEAVTDLCPPELCRADVQPLTDRLLGMGVDLGVIYLHILLTPDLRADLPDVSGAWAGFAAQNLTVDSPSPDAWKKRWHQARTRDKRQVALGFIAGISAADPQPTFYFMHSLLSHHPYVYLPTGQESSTRINAPWPRATVGIDDPWALLQQQQRQLLHTRYIDVLVGRLIKRLKDAALYERTLLVLTSDHGVAFRPGSPLRTFSEPSASDIMRVPLIIKFPTDVPRTASGAAIPRSLVSDTNAETVDILPTIADALGTRVPWPTDGRSLLDPSVPERLHKRIYYRKGWKPQWYGREGPPLRAALRQKSEIFDGAANKWRIPRSARYAELVGRSVRELQIQSHSAELASVRQAWRYANVDLAAEAVPFEVSGRLLERSPGTEPVYIAVAVNGVVQAVTQTWKTRPAEWLATPPLEVWRPGRNDVEVFVIRETGGQVLLDRAFRTKRRPADLNLISRAAAAWGISQRGLYQEEVRRDRMIRWTDRRASISVPLDDHRPRALRIKVARSSRPHHRLRIAASDCVLFEGPVPTPEWEATFGLERCWIAGNTLNILLESEVVRPPRDSRNLGIALRSIVLDETPPEGRGREQ